MELCSLKGLSFKYTGADSFALSDITFTVQQGEMITLCGLSGCGKSTLLRHFKTCLSPAGTLTGEVLFEGRPLSQTDERTQSSRIGFVMQSPESQCVTDKVWHELVFGLESLGMKQSAISRRAAETAAFFGIENLLDRSVEELSGGQKQILSLASVIAMQPSLLLLDEPTSRLDPVSAYEFISLLGKINRELGTTIIISEHSLEQVLPLSTRVLVMSDGRIIADGTPSQCALSLFKIRHHAFLSFPAPARIACYTGSFNGSRDLPMSVSEGRAWLREISSEHPLREIPQKAPPDKTKPLMSLKELYFRYDKKSPDILKGLSLDIYKGEKLSILGGNGSGKTTLLNILSGSIAAYSGSITADNKRITRPDPKKQGTAYMPQDPALLFIRNTVKEELFDVLSDKKLTDNEKRQRADRVTELCELSGILNRHPFDISGGEAQKLALAKLLLTEPDILLLDEPTKGLDCACKRRLALILDKLSENGTTIITVTHDTEFAAANSDRCAMLFGGRIVSCEEPLQFFSQNAVYTTSCSRMSRDIQEGIITPSDLLYALSAENTDEQLYNKLPPENPPDGTEPEGGSSAGRKKSPLKLTLTMLSVIIFAVSLSVTAGIIYIPFFSETLPVTYTVLFLSAVLIPVLSDKGHGRYKLSRIKRQRNAVIISSLFTLIAVPLTVIWGVFLLDGTKYIFISLLILLESFVPFYFMLGRQPLKARELVVIALLCAMCTAGRAAFYMLPACKPVTAIVIISAVCLGSETGFLIGETAMLASNIFFGQGVWTPWQMLSMGLIGYITGLIFSKGIIPVTRVTLSVWGFIAALVIYGGIMDPSTLILSGTPVNAGTLMSVYAAGLPLDTVHAVTTAVFIYIAADGLILRLERLKLSGKVLLHQ